MLPLRLAADGPKSFVPWPSGTRSLPIELAVRLYCQRLVSLTSRTQPCALVNARRPQRTQARSWG